MGATHTRFCDECDRSLCPERDHSPERGERDHSPERGERSRNYEFMPGKVPGRESADFAVVQLNVLADQLALLPMHKYCPRRWRVWKYRKAKILEGLKRADAEIICLQECQGSQTNRGGDHHGWFNHVLRESGYQAASYATKQGEQPVRLGNAVFVKAAAFEGCPAPGVTKWRDRVFLSKAISGMCRTQAQRDRFAHRRYGQVAAWARVRHRETGNVLVVVTVHLTSDWRSPDVQLAQAQALLDHLEREVVQTGDSLLICGDFNSQPGSAVHTLLTRGRTEAPPGSVEPLSDEARHGLGLASAHARLHGAEPALTTKTDEFEGTLDYIFFGSRSLAPVGSLPTPTVEQAEAMPSQHIPSDHVPLGVSFNFARQ